jgi:hypothetical protein
VERALDSDVQQLCAAKYNPVTDIVSRKSASIHTRRIAQFFNTIQDDNISASEEGIALAVQVLTSLSAALECRSTVVEFMRKLSITSGRRPKLRKGLSKHKRRALLFMAPQDRIQEIEKRISDSTKQLSTELRQDRKVPRIAQSHIQQKLAALNNGAASGYSDIGAAPIGSTYADSTALEAYKGTYQKLLHQQRKDADRAQEARRAMIVKVYSTADYVPLADFR